MSGLGNILDMMRNAKQMMAKAKEAQGELAKKTVEGSAGIDMVNATVNGLGELVGLKIDPVAITPEDPEMLADLIIAAVADARKKSLVMRGDMMKDLTGGIDLSSMGLDVGNML